MNKSDDHKHLHNTMEARLGDFMSVAWHTGNNVTRCVVARLRNIWCNDLRFTPQAIKNVDAQMEKLDPDWLKISFKSNAGPKKHQEPKTPTYDVKNIKSANIKEVIPAASKEGKQQNKDVSCEEGEIEDEEVEDKKEHKKVQERQDRRDNKQRDFHKNEYRNNRRSMNYDNNRHRNNYNNRNNDYDRYQNNRNNNFRGDFRGGRGNFNNNHHFGRNQSNYRDSPMMQNYGDSPYDNSPGFGGPPNMLPGDRHNMREMVEDRRHEQISRDQSASSREEKKNKRKKKKRRKSKHKKKHSRKRKRHSSSSSSSSYSSDSSDENSSQKTTSDDVLVEETTYTEVPHNQKIGNLMNESRQAQMSVLGKHKSTKKLEPPANKRVKEISFALKTNKPKQLTAADWTMPIEGETIVVVNNDSNPHQSNKMTPPPAMFSPEGYPGQFGRPQSPFVAQQRLPPQQQMGYQNSTYNRPFPPQPVPPPNFNAGPPHPSANAQFASPFPQQPPVAQQHQLQPHFMTPMRQQVIKLKDSDCQTTTDTKDNSTQCKLRKKQFTKITQTKSLETRSVGIQIAKRTYDKGTQMYSNVDDAMDSNLLNGQMNLLEMPRIHPSGDELMKKFRDFLDNRRMCDCTLVIQEKEYKAHQLILSAKSQPFNQLLKNNNRITIRNITKIVWTQLLYYMYGQPIEISSQKNANELKEGILTLEIDSLFDVGAKLDDAVAKKISIEGWIIENDRIRDLREERKAKMPIIERKVEKTPAKPAASSLRRSLLKVGSLRTIQPSIE